MLTRIQKKRTAGKDNLSCPQNSNQNLYSPDAVEVGAMVTTDHGGSTSGDQDDDSSQRTDYLHVAWLLREKLSDLVDGGDKGEFPELGLRSLLDMAASRKIVSVDPKMLNPLLWRTLPKDMLLLVLACLPVPDIAGLRSLSREWRRDMTTVNSDFIQACDEASRIMVAIVSCNGNIVREGFLDSEFLVTICDVSTHTLRSQYSYRLRPGSPTNGRWNDMGALDGGLVCFVSAWRPSKANPLSIVVVNLLTQVARKLPPLQYVYSSPPQMMHIEVDSETKDYRVVVVGKNIKGRPTVEMYHSGARKWTKATPPLGFIFGHTYTWEYSKFHKAFRSRNPIPSVYDFAEGQVKHYIDPGVMAIRKDCKFVLHRNTSIGEISQAEGYCYCITKYRLMQTNAKDWVQERSYLCSPLENISFAFHWSMWILKASEGYLMVFPNRFDFWLLDLSTGEWSGFPNWFQGEEYDYDRTSMCQAFWNVVP